LLSANPLIIFPFASPLIAISLTLARDEKEYCTLERKRGWGEGRRGRRKGRLMRGKGLKERREGQWLDEEAKESGVTKEQGKWREGREQMKGETGRREGKTRRGKGQGEGGRQSAKGEARQGKGKGV
jgi:hypothetical protein